MLPDPSSWSDPFEFADPPPIKRLPTIRKTLGLSQKQIAPLLNTSQKNLSDWERGDPDDVPSEINQLIEGLDELLSYFFRDCEDEENSEIAEFIEEELNYLLTQYPETARHLIWAVSFRSDSEEYALRNTSDRVLKLLLEFGKNEAEKESPFRFLLNFSK